MNIFLITKITAFIIMVIDHIGYWYTIKALRIIGRISFPLFCLLMGYGTKKTKKPFIRVLKLLIYGLISIPICKYYFHNNGLNIILGFCVFTFVIYFVKKLNLHAFTEVLLILTAASAVSIYGFEYLFLPIILCYIFYKVDNKYLSVILFAITECIYVSISTFKTNIYSLLAIPFILVFYYMIDYYKKHNIELKRKEYNNKFMIFIQRNIFYILYPLHLCILVLIFKLIG